MYYGRNLLCCKEIFDFREPVGRWGRIDSKSSVAEPRLCCFDEAGALFKHRSMI